MKHLPLIHSTTIAFAILISSLSLNAGEFTFHHENVLGTSLELTVVCDNIDKAKQAELETLELIDQQSEIFSNYSPTSEFSRFLKLDVGESMPISLGLMQVLKHCENWRKVSQDAFNPAVETFSRRWKEASETEQIPSAEELRSIAQRIARQHWVIDTSKKKITRTSNEPLSLNAIAKGTILDVVSEHLQNGSLQIQGGMINLGGDLRIFGSLQQKVAIANPLDDALGAKPARQIVLANLSIATSGPSERFLKIGSMRYSHIIDPRTGLPCSETISASVIAKDAESADVLATISSVLPPQMAMKLIDSIPFASCCLITASGETWLSSNWPEESDHEIAAKNETQEQKEQSAPQTEETGHEFVVEFEIAKAAEARRYRRPYVAVWVEDEEGFPVKTLSLFLMTDNPGPRWHRDLRRWYSSEQVRQLADDTKLIGTISKPTRNPGNYKVAWDGRDDQGKLLKDGKYTLFIESAREHGTYQLMKLPFEFGKDEFEETLKGNQEIKTASMTYRKNK